MTNIVGVGQMLGRLLTGSKETLADYLTPGRLVSADVVSVFQERAVLSLARGVLLEVRLQAALAEGQRVTLQVQPPPQQSQRANQETATVVLRLVDQEGEGQPGHQVAGEARLLPRAEGRPANGTPEAGQRPVPSDIPTGRPAPPPPPRPIVYEAPPGWREGEGARAPAQAQPTAPPAATPAPTSGQPSGAPPAMSEAGGANGGQPPAQGAAPGQGAAAAPGTAAGMAPDAASGTAPGAPPGTASGAMLGATPNAAPSAASGAAAGIPPGTSSTPAAAPAPGTAPGAAAPSPAPGTTAATVAPAPEAVAAQTASPTTAPAPAAPPIPTMPLTVPGEMVAWLPLPLPGGGQGWAQIKVEEQKRKKAKREHERYYQVRIWWETPELGAVQVLLDAAPEGKLVGIFTVAAATLRASIEERLPRLAESLQQAGYPAAQLGARTARPGEQPSPPASGSTMFDRRV